ncbi:hypothetical protein FGO68_gene9433 [Halteria grandinella]|uniref:ABM domain-containing protein n=1 Tax=Halteria grandinella TaxID=5974 RepID=A0A8J8NH98_HALGN|nr:hypothetical protein FGO68_gene9433 [Halteria grandinella]
MSTIVHVIATITVKEGTLDQFAAAFKDVQPLVLAEEGAIEYNLATDIASGIPIQIPLRTNVATIVEKWASLEHLHKHLQAPHMGEFMAKIKDIAEGTTLQVLSGSVAKL